MANSGRAKHVGWFVHGWMFPVVWWARRKPRSAVRQNLWNAAEWIDWYVSFRPRLRRMFK